MLNMNLILSNIKIIINRIYIYIFLNPYLLSIVINIIYFLFLGFSDAIFCDDSFLDNLKFSLEKDTDKYYNAIENFNKYYELFKQAKVRPEKNNGLEEYLLNKSLFYNQEVSDRLLKIRLTENIIKQFDSSFVSKIRKE